MSFSNDVIYKELTKIKSITTSHGVGLKKVLISNVDTSSAVTQIAHTTLHKGDTVEAHIHKSMDEHFLFLSGNARVKICGDIYICKEDSYLYIAAGKSHEIYALDDIDMITIGIAL